MSNFKIGQVIQWSVAHSREKGFYRILWKNVKVDKIWLIEVPTNSRRTDYCRGPFIVSFSELHSMLENLHITTTDIEVPSFWLLSDDAIRERYSRKDGKCSTLEARERRWSWIAGLFSSHSMQDIFEANMISRWVSEKARETGKTTAKIYDAVHTYLAGGFYKNSLLMDWHRCGAPGKERVQSKKLGRPNAARIVDPSRGKGYYLTKDDKKIIRYAWKHFLVDGKTVYAAFLEMAGVFYRSGTKQLEGREVPILLPAGERPTIDQFRYWGPRDDPKEEAWRKKLGKLDWARNYKGLSGSAKDGIVAVGQTAFCDTTSNDTHLVSVASRLKAVGTLNRLEIYEARSELIVGFHCGFEPPSYRTFLLAVAHGASSKVDYCAHFGIQVSDEDFPAVAFKYYLGDNGEYRSAPAIDALRNVSSTVEWAASGHAELKGPIEGHHHRMHARLDHTLDGTTHGKPRQRGQGNPILEACLTYYEYMKEYIKEVVYYNTQENADHLLTVEMRREGVKPTRIEIYRWLVKKGYVIDFTPDISIVRAHLLPPLPALLTETGIYLLREDRGDKNEKIWGLRYMSDYLVESGLLAEARKNGTKRLTVRGNPEDPQVMWLVTNNGSLKELRNVFDDPVLYSQGTVHDCIAIQDDDKVREICERGEVDQQRSDILTVREANLKDARIAKHQEIESLPERPSKADLISGIDANRREEIRLLAEREKQAAFGSAEDVTPNTAHQPNIQLELSSQFQDPSKLALQRYLNKKEKE